MSDARDKNSDKKSRTKDDVVSTMPVEIASLRARLQRLDAQLSGVDDNLERIAGSDPNATEEIRMTPGQRARIDAASLALEDTDTNMRAFVDSSDPLAEVDALLGEFDNAPAPPDLPLANAESASMGRRDTMPEMQAQSDVPVATPEALSSNEGEKENIASDASEAEPAERGALVWGALLLLLLGGAFGGWYVLQGDVSSPSLSTQKQAQPALGPNAAPPSALAEERALRGGGEREMPEVASASKPSARAPLGDVPPKTLPSSLAADAKPEAERGANEEALKSAVKVAQVAPEPKSHPESKDVAIAASAATPPPREEDKSAAKHEIDLGKVKALSALSEGELLEAMEALRSDPAPPEIVRGIHYFVSNESKHYLWREDVRDTGGIMIGVGAEQNYMIAGWAKPEVLVLMDFDIYIPWLHKAYRVAFELAETPSELIALWRDNEGREQLKAGIVSTYGETGEVQDILRALKFAKPVGRHLSKVQARYVKLGVPCFLTDQEQFDFVKGLWAKGRVIALRGDLTGKRTMVDLAAFSRISELPIRVLYMSNAEFYFRFSKGRFRDNIVGLPFDDDSLVLRTDPHSGTKYRYYTQRGADFVAWLERGRASNIAGMGKFRTKRGDVDDFILDKLPEEVGRRR